MARLALRLNAEGTALVSRLATEHTAVNEKVSEIDIVLRALALYAWVYESAHGFTASLSVSGTQSQVVEL